MTEELKKEEKYIPRTFIPGDQWVYYKVYCGPKTGDKVLTRIVLPMVQELMEAKVIDSWFFIRYGDPDFHIRLRFRPCNKGSIAVIADNFNQRLMPYVQENLIWNVVMDTYQQEVERYGRNSMQLAEDIFYADAQMITELVDMIDGEEGERVRWLFSLRAMDAFLDDFGLTTEDKMNLLRSISASFGKEHNKDEFLAKQLSKKFRESKKDIQDVLNPAKDEESEMKPAFELIQQKSENIKKPVAAIKDLFKANKMEIRFFDLLSSYLHMLNNRLFRSKNRLHELVVYDFLFRYYKSKHAREMHEKKK